MDLNSGTLRLRLSCIVVVAGLWSAFAVAPGLWLDHPIFGTVPVIEGLPRIVAPFDGIFLGAIVLLLVPAVAARRPQRWIGVWCAVFALRCLYDRITWQPYYYQYFLMLLPLAFAGWGSGRGAPRRDAAALDACRLVIVCVYFWSGVAKLNRTFLGEGMMTMLLVVFSADAAKAIHETIVLVPLFEIAVALALLVRRLRLAAV
jgi:hypothetical protein